MNSALPFRQSPRLQAFDYTGNYVYNLGAVTRGRAPLLSNPDSADYCTQALGAACRKYRFQCLAYCFMPDHAHLLVGSEAGSSVEDFMRHFKQLSGYAYKQATGTQLWQTSYYDRVLRQEEAIRPIAEYIWMNPVRKGLVAEPLHWQHSGPREYMVG